MIDSIVELPEYICDDNNAIYGERYCSLYSGLISQESDILNMRVDGRRLVIPKGFHKYKIKLTDYQANRIYTIVGVASQKVDLTSVHPDREQAIDFYPLYVREYSRNGKSHGKNGNVFLWIPGINRLFERIMLPEVTSLTATFMHLISTGSVKSFDYVPSEIADNDLDPRFATLAPIPEGTMYSFMNANSLADHDILRVAVDQCCTLTNYFTDRVMYCLHTTKFGQLNCLLDTIHQTDPISSIARQAEQSDWANYYTWIHQNEEQIDRYVSNDRNEAVARLLHMSSLIPTTDFNIECNSASLRSSKLEGFNPFTLNTIDNMEIEYVRARVAEYVHHLFCSDYFRDTRRFTLSGSYLEELCVYDVCKELVGYIDQVWWILATGYGLINCRSAYL